MANIIKIKRSAVAGKTPTDADLVEGELALNTADSVLWTKNSDGVIKQVGKQVSADFIHDSLQGFVEEEHIDWTVTNAAKIHSSNLPNVAKTSVQTAIDSTAMLTLITEEGDVVVRTDQSKTYVRNAGLVGDMTDFTELLAEGVTYDPTTLQAEVDVNTAKVGITVAQANAITTNSDKVGITVAQANAIATNSAKVGITTTQSDAITTNSDKVGITTTQSDAITTNSDKVGITTTQSDAIATNSAKVGITTTQSDAIATNSAKVGITVAQANAITTNSDKVGITTTQSDAIATNSAKVGITTTQSDAIATNSAKVGITTTQSDAIATNSAKVSNVAHPVVPVGALFTDTLYQSSDFTHDNLIGVEANEHIDWTGASAGTIHLTNLPATALTSVQTAVDENAMFALTTEEGDVVVRSDLSKTYMHNGGTAGTMADFTLLQTPTDVVSSVDGAIGVITLNHDTLAGFEASEHIDWSATSTSVIHADNYTDTVYDPTTLQAEVTLNTAKVGITVAQANAIATNSAKVGITTTQSDAIATNSAKVGITVAQANAITTNSAKVSNVAHPVVPVGALFTDTDTVYTHPANHAISVITGLQTALDSKVTEDASSTTLVAATTTVIFSMPLATYRSAKLMITAKQGTKYETLELTVLHDGTNSFHNEFGVVYSDVDFVTLTTDVSGANVRVLALTAAVSTIKVNARKQPV